MLCSSLRGLWILVVIQHWCMHGHRVDYLFHSLSNCMQHSMQRKICLLRERETCLVHPCWTLGWQYHALTITLTCGYWSDSSSTQGQDSHNPRHSEMKISAPGTPDLPHELLSKPTYSSSYEGSIPFSHCCCHQLWWESYREIILASN